MHLSVIIPAYNEEGRLPKTLKSLSGYFSLQSYDYEIIVVSDGSKDKTDMIVRAMAKDIPCLKLIGYEINRGKGYAVRTGMLLATGDYRIFMDADGSTSIEQMEKMLPYLSDGYDVIISSRRAPGACIKKEQPWYRLLLGWIFRVIVEYIVPLGIKDSQNGFKMFSGKAATDTFSRQTVSGWAFDIEILKIAKELSYKIKEVPIVWADDDKSRMTLMGMLKMLKEILKIRFQK